MKKKNINIDKRIRDIESKLVPILSTPLNPETTESDQVVVENVNKYLNFIETLLSTEMATVSEPRPFANAARRVNRLQKAVHAWTEGRPLTPSTNNSAGSSPRSLIESCLTDDDGGYYYDYKGEVSGVGGYNVYDNPLFDDLAQDYVENHDYDDHSIIDGFEVEEIGGNEEEDIITIVDQDEVQEQEAVIEGVENEVIRVDNLKEESTKDDDGEEVEEEEEEEGGRNYCCFKIMFWGMMTVTVGISVMVGFYEFPDNHTSVMFLTPT